MKNDILYKIMVILGLGLLAFIIGLEIYCWVNYGNLPPDQIPSWVHWFMLKGKR
jgi:hypothetical protein